MTLDPRSLLFLALLSSGCASTHADADAGPDATPTELACPFELSEEACGARLRLGCAYGFPCEEPEEAAEAPARAGCFSLVSCDDTSACPPAHTCREVALDACPEGATACLAVPCISRRVCAPDAAFED